MKINFLKFNIFIVLMTFVLGIVNAQIQYPNSFYTSSGNIEVKNDKTFLGNHGSQGNTDKSTTVEVIIGTGNVMEEYPIYAYYGYSYSQSIYLKSDINVQGNITHISYHFNGSSLSKSNNWTIYMGHTTKSSISGTSDWIALSGLTQVYSGTFTSPTGPGWLNFTLNTPFFYNNNDNLVIAVDENTPDFNESTDQFLSTSTPTVRSLIYRNDYTNPEPSSPPTATYADAYIPNIKMQITTTNPNDVGVSEIIAPEAGMLPGNVIPQITVKNFGWVPQTNVLVSYKIDTNGTVNNMTVASLDAGATTNVSFPSWTANLGTYNFIYYTNLSTDGNLTNDTLKRTLSVVNRLNKAFCLKDNMQPVSFILENPVGGFTEMGNPVPWLSRAGVYFSTSETAYKWIVLGSDKNLYTIDTLNGIVNIIGATGIADIFLSGLTYDKSTQTLYASGLDGTYPNFTFHLYRLNQTSGAATLVATSPTHGCFFEIACNTEGQMYTIESRTDSLGKLYSLNKTTGELTLIGTNLGGIISSSPQDIEFTDNNILYFTAYKGNDGVLDGLYIINTITGKATLVSPFKVANTALGGLGIKTTYGASIPGISNKDNQISIFPNPVKDFISVVSKDNEMINSVKVISISGQLVYTENVNYIATTINTTNMSAGFYFIQVLTNAGLYTQKIIVTK